MNVTIENICRPEEGLLLCCVLFLLGGCSVVLGVQAAMFVFHLKKLNLKTVKKAQTDTSTEDIAMFEKPRGFF